MLSQRNLLNIFVVACFFVVIIMIRFSEKYEVYFESFRRNLRSGFPRNENRWSNGFGISMKKRVNEAGLMNVEGRELNKVKRPEVIEDTFIDTRTRIAAASVGNANVNKEQKEMVKVNKHDLKMKGSDSLKKTNFTTVFVSKKKDFNISSVRPILHKDFKPNKTLNLFTSTAGSLTNNIYMKNLGNWTVYGDGSCARNSNRNILEKLFIKWISIAKESGVEFFLTCGTLLGSFRNGELIPHDTDLDILINRKDFHRIKKYESRRNFSGYESDFHVAVQEDFYQPYSKRRRFTCRGKQTPVYRDHCSFQEPLGRLITENRHLDIYDYTERGSVIWDPSEGGREFSKTDIFPLQKCMLMGHETKCPHRPKEVLYKFYGKDLSPLTTCKNGEWLKKSQ